MYERFLKRYSLDRPRDQGGGQVPTANAGLGQFFAAFAGASFGRGLYRVVNSSTVHLAEAFVREAFPKYQQVSVFSYDWLGRVFALDPARREAAGPGVLLMEPGTGEALEVPCSLEDFHERELVDQSDAAVGAPFHRKWLDSGGTAPTVLECVGYRKPLFLGGDDRVDNLELSDLDVYWTLAGQLISKTRGLPPGTRVRAEKFGGGTKP